MQKKRSNAGTDKSVICTPAMSKSLRSCSLITEGMAPIHTHSLPSANFPTGTSTGNTNSPDKRSKGTAFNVREWRDCEWWTLYERPIGIVEDSTVVARYAFTATGPNPKMDVQIKVFLDIAFGKGSPLEGLGVKKTLLSIGPYVSDIIEEFRIKFAGQMF